MNKYLVLKDYASKPAGTPIATGQDMTAVANVLMNASGGFVELNSKLAVASTEPRVAFMYRNIEGMPEGLIVIEKPVSVVKMAVVAGVAKVGTWTLAGNLEALKVGDYITMLITDLTKDPYDQTRNITFTYILTDLDNLTTPGHASYYTKRIATAFNLQHGAFGTMTASVDTSSDTIANTITITPVDVIDFTLSTGGVFTYVTEGTGTAYVAPVGSAKQVMEQEHWYSTERGNTNATTKQNSLMYSTGSAVDLSKTYLQYVLTWQHLSIERPLGQGTTAVTRTLVLAIESDATNVATLETALEGLFDVTL